MLIYFSVTKVYVAFNDLHNLNILLRECKMSFKIGSLTCVKYIEKQPIQAPPTFCGEHRLVPNFEKRWASEKMSA